MIIENAKNLKSGPMADCGRNINDHSSDHAT